MGATTAFDRKNRIICGLDPADVDRMIEELVTAEIKGEIEVVGPEEGFRLKHPPQDCGLSCQLNRVFLGMGDDLAEFEWERTQLERGHAIVAVPASNEDTRAKVRQIMAGHCQTSLHVYGKWTTKAV